jgi:hypothetical protein
MRRATPTSYSHSYPMTLSPMSKSTPFLRPCHPVKARISTRTIKENTHPKFCKPHHYFPSSPQPPSFYLKLFKQNKKYVQSTPSATTLRLGVLSTSRSTVTLCSRHASSDHGQERIRDQYSCNIHGMACIPQHCYYDRWRPNSRRNQPHARLSRPIKITISPIQTVPLFLPFPTTGRGRIEWV